jgi:hypothetical protein
MPVRHLLAVSGYRVSANSTGPCRYGVIAAAYEWFVRFGTCSPWLDALGGTEFCLLVCAGQIGSCRPRPDHIFIIRPIRLCRPLTRCLAWVY